MNLKVGDSVWIKRLWNAAERQPNQISVPAPILSIDFGAHSQTGVMLSVQAKDGSTVALDAGWFDEPRT